MNQQTKTENRFKTTLKRLSTQQTISGNDLKAIIEYQNRAVLEEMGIQLDTRGVALMEAFLITFN